MNKKISKELQEHYKKLDGAQELYQKLISYYLDMDLEVPDHITDTFDELDTIYCKNEGISYGKYLAWLDNKGGAV